MYCPCPMSIRVLLYFNYSSIQRMYITYLFSISFFVVVVRAVYWHRQRGSVCVCVCVWSTVLNRIWVGGTKARTPLSYFIFLYFHELILLFVCNIMLHCISCFRSLALCGIWCSIPACPTGTFAVCNNNVLCRAVHATCPWLIHIWWDRKLIFFFLFHFTDSFIVWFWTDHIHALQLGE